MRLITLNCFMAQQASIKKWCKIEGAYGAPNMEEKAIAFLEQREGE